MYALGLRSPADAHAPCPAPPCPVLPQVRLSAYESAIAACQDLLRDKVVLDVGCGYGVLSMLCAQVRGVRAQGHCLSGTSACVRGCIEKPTFVFHMAAG